MSVEVQGLNLNIVAKSDVGKTASDLEHLSSVLKNFNITRQKAESLKLLGTAVNAFALAINKIDSSKVQGFASSIEALGKIKVGKNIKDLTDSLAGLDFRKLSGEANALNRILSPLTDTMERLARATKDIKLGSALSKAGKMPEQKAIEKPWENKSGESKIEQTKREYVSLGEAIRRVNGALSQTSVGKYFDQVKQDVKAVVGFVRNLGSAFSSSLKHVKRFAGHLTAISRIGVINPFRGFAKSISESAGKLKNLYSSMKRIFMYRAIRSAIKEISQGIREGVNNLYQWSKLTGEDMYRFRDTMNSLSTSALYLKNSLGAMVSPLLNMLAPAVDYVVDKFVALINVINQFFARIAGQATWTAALKYPKEFADEVGGAAKKAKDNIQDFDELHILRTPSGGGGAAAEDYSKMFEERAFETEVSNWVDSFKDAIKQGDWYGAGAIIGEELNKAINNLDASALGKKLATKINQGFSLWYGFIKTTDFQNLGGKIADFLNSGFDTLDTNLIGKTFARKWTMIVDLAYGFVTNFDFAKFGTAVSNFVQGWFEEIDGEKLGKTLSGAIKGAFKAGTAFFSNEDARKEFINDINGFFNGLDWNEIHFNAVEFASSFTTWFKNSMKDLDTEAIGKSIGGAIHTALDACITFIDEGGLDALVDGLIDIINNIDWYDALIKGLYIGAKIAEALLDVIIGALTGQTTRGTAYVQTEIVDSSYGAYKAGQYTGKTYTKQYVASDAGDGLVTGLATAVGVADYSKLRDAFKALLEKAFSAAVKIAEFIVDPFAKKASDVILTYVFGIDREGNSMDEVMKDDKFYQFTKLMREGKHWLFDEGDPLMMQAATLDPGSYKYDETIKKLNQRKFNQTVNSIFGFVETKAGATGATGGKLLGQQMKLGFSAADTARVTKYHAAVYKVEEAFKDVIADNKELGKESEDTINGMISGWDNFGNRVNEGATNSFSSATAKITSLMDGLVTDTDRKMNDVGGAIVTSINNTSLNIEKPLQEVKTKISNAYADAGNEAIAKMNEFKPRLSEALSQVSTKTSEGLNAISGVWGGFKDSVTVSGNAVIGVCERVANGVITAFNTLKLSVGGVMNTIKNALSGDDNKALSFNFPTLSTISIPRLATGGIATSPVNALIGEAGKEAVLPLESNTGWMDVLADRVNSTSSEDTELLREQNDLLRQLLAKKTGITSREIFDAVREENNEYFVRTGNNALVM